MPRIYISQALVDQWMGNGLVQLEGDLLRLNAGGMPTALFITPSVSFEGVDGGGADPYQLVGCVKTAHELGEMGAEHFDTSVVIGDVAYTVRPGFVGVPVGADGTETLLDPASWARLTTALGQMA